MTMGSRVQTTEISFSSFRSIFPQREVQIEFYLQYWQELYSQAVITLLLL